MIAMGVALFKISTSSICANNILEQLIRSSSARIIAVEPEFIVVEKTGTQDDIKNFLDSLSGFDVREFIQSGRVVVTRPM